MTEENSQQIDVGARVELLPGKEAVYERAVAGAQAIVEAVKTDKDGFQMIKVSWDRRHWRYSGEPDQWTYLEHFKQVENKTIFEARDNPRKFAQQMLERAERQGLNDEQINDYLEYLNEAITILSESEGFIILTAREEVTPDGTGQVLVPYVMGSFLSKRTSALLESKVMTMAAMMGQEMAEKIIDQSMEDEDDDD